ncbi:hypothetical protein GCM10023323_29180 [Streptomyces thinghirensis]|uniref:Uncharacterized protein n=1 Tax=Streptomyces thinghirensis TaxID=551547 RepID=A0ABP9T5I2_9ACTN
MAGRDSDAPGSPGECRVSRRGAQRREERQGAAPIRVFHDQFSSHMFGSLLLEDQPKSSTASMSTWLGTPPPFAYLPTWAWLDGAKFKPVSVTASVPLLGVQAITTAEPVSVEIDPGTADAEIY